MAPWLFPRPLRLGRRASTPNSGLWPLILWPWEATEGLFLSRRVMVKKKGGGCFWRIRVAAACRVSWIEGKDRGQEARSGQRGGGLSPGAVETEEEEEMGLRDGWGRWEGRGSPQPQMSRLSSSDGDGTLRCGKLAPVPRLSQPQLSVGRGETSAGGEEETRLCMEVRGNQPGPEGSGRRGLGARRCWGAMEGS